jgi:hypothetical protein
VITEQRFLGVWQVGDIVIVTIKDKISYFPKSLDSGRGNTQAFGVSVFL